MSDELRRGPSGPLQNLTTDDIVNRSDLPGGTLTQALDDFVYPAPGGGLLRVPALGGVAAPMRGTLPGQLAFWKQSQSLWLPTPTAPADGQFAVWNAAAEEWQFVNAPTVGDIRYFDNTIPSAGLWNFNETLVDTSGNGNDLSLEAGSLFFADIVPGKKGLWIPAGIRLGTAASRPALTLLGDMTIEAIIQLNTNPTTGFSVCAYGGSGEASTANFLYTLNVNGAPPIALAAFWETGAGVDVNYGTVPPASLPPIHNILYVAQVRSAGGTRVQHYANGKPFGTLSGALTAPTDGSLSRFLVGVSSSTGLATESGVIMAIKIVSRALSAAEVLSEYNRTLGPGYGILT